MELFLILTAVVMLVLTIFSPYVRCRLGIHDYSPVDPKDPVCVDVCQWCGKVEVRSDRRPIPHVSANPPTTTRQLTDSEAARYAPFKSDLDAVTRRTESAQRPHATVPFRQRDMTRSDDPRRSDTDNDYGGSSDTDSSSCSD